MDTNNSGMGETLCKPANFPNEYNEEQKALLIQLKMTQINIADVEKALKEMERLDEGYTVRADFFKTLPKKLSNIFKISPPKKWHFSELGEQWIYGKFAV